MKILIPITIVGSDGTRYQGLREVIVDDSMIAEVDAVAITWSAGIFPIERPVKRIFPMGSKVGKTHGKNANYAASGICPRHRHERRT